jgi:hypothetical protein
MRASFWREFFLVEDSRKWLVAAQSGNELVVGNAAQAAPEEVSCQLKALIDK